MRWIGSMKNPLNKRFIRELREDWTKYLVIFLLMTGMIGLVSGFIVADESILKAYNESFEKYNIEDGHFNVDKKLNNQSLINISKHGVTLYDHSYVEETLINKNKVRIFATPQEVNKVCVIEGNLPRNDNEIAIDRMYATNNKLGVGDYIKSHDHRLRISGLVALSDYSALFENNSDTMFDAIKFGVGVVTPSLFNQWDTTHKTYSYSWLYNNTPSNEEKRSESFLKQLNKEVHLEEYIPRYQNQAINFTGDDMGGDGVMVTLMLYILIVIIAFVFAVTMTNTIQKESNVIGTLLASGYTKKELIMHYMTLPILVTFVSALIGNILGYTYFKKTMADMYYASYSLVSYKTIWNASAFIKTTVVPIIMMFVINLGILYRQLSLSPLKFLRRDLKRHKQSRVMPLSHRIPFLSRFRTRIILQNKAHYLVLFVGLIFANMLLLFGLGMTDMLDLYSQDMKNNMLANYQYILKVPASLQTDSKDVSSMIEAYTFMKGIETDSKTAEKFSAYSLKIKDNDIDTVSVYGIKENSRYVNIPKGVYVSSAYAQKYKVNKGDVLHLETEYDHKNYKLKVSGVYNYPGTIAVFMNQKEMNKLFDLDDDYFSGYFSSTPIKDIKEKYIATTIDYKALTKISRQLEVSMGSMTYLLCGLAIVMFIVIIFILTKTIIEKNAQSISMTKILGYTDHEISLIYIVSTTILVSLFILITVPLDYVILKPIFEVMMKEKMAGWIALNIRPITFVYTALIGFVSYFVVMVLEYKKIKKIPMQNALKNVE